MTGSSLFGEYRLETSLGRIMLSSVNPITPGVMNGVEPRQKFAGWRQPK
jgi:hypothetical protein